MLVLRSFIIKFSGVFVNILLSINELLNFLGACVCSEIVIVIGNSDLKLQLEIVTKTEE